MSNSKVAYLLKNGEVRIMFVGDPPSKSSEAVVLLTPKLENFNAIINETYDDDQIAAVSKALEEAGSLPEEHKPKIEMYGKYDCFYQVPRIFTRVSYPEEFVMKLNHVLTDAKISIKGTYKVVQNVAIPSYIRRQADLEMMRLEMQVQAQVYNNRPPQIRRQPPSPAVLNRIAAGTWTPVDNQLQSFYVKDIEVKEKATYETFEGIERMGELYKSDGFKHAELSYSVVLEWKDFGMKTEECERNVLGKLFQDKLLVDCTIVVAKTNEFKCHRSILAVHSDVLRANLESGMEESKTNRILIDDLLPEAVELMLQFMYCQKLELKGKSGDVVIHLLKAAHKYNIGQLEKLTLQFLSRQPNDWFTMNGALGLYFFTANVDSCQNLTKKLTTIMRANPQQLSSCSTYKEWMSKSPNAAAQFALMLLESEAEPIHLSSHSDRKPEQQERESGI